MADTPTLRELAEDWEQQARTTPTGGTLRLRAMDEGRAEALRACATELRATLSAPAQTGGALPEVVEACARVCLSRAESLADESPTAANEAHKCAGAILSGWRQHLAPSPVEPTEADELTLRLETLSSALEGIEALVARVDLTPLDRLQRIADEIPGARWAFPSPVEPRTEGER